MCPAVPFPLSPTLPAPSFFTWLIVSTHPLTMNSNITPRSAPCHQLGCLPPLRASKAPSAFSPLAFWSPVLPPCANQSISPVRLWVSCQPSFLYSLAPSSACHTVRTQWMSDRKWVCDWLLHINFLSSHPAPPQVNFLFVLWESHLLFWRLLSKLQFPAAMEEKVREGDFLPGKCGLCIYCYRKQLRSHWRIWIYL